MKKLTIKSKYTQDSLDAVPQRKEPHGTWPTDTTHGFNGKRPKDWLEFEKYAIGCGVPSSAFWDDAGHCSCFAGEEETKERAG
jgi:hypothetical protein